MNPLEERVRTALDARADSVRPRPGALEENRRRLRRDFVTRRAAIPVIASLAAASMAIGVSVAVGHRTSPGPAGPAAPRLVTTMEDFASLSSVVTIDGRVAGGKALQIEALGTDGSVLGRTPDSAVWEATARRPEPKALGVRAVGGLATGAGFRAWVSPGENDVHCRDLPAGPTMVTKVISPQDAWPKWGFWASDEILVWRDSVGQPYATSACAPGRMLTITNPRPGDINHAGDILALSGTDLFSTNATDNRNLLEIDARTGRVKARHPLPEGVPRVSIPPVTISPPRTSETTRTLIQTGPMPDPWYAAANEEVFAWAVGGALRVTDRETWRQTVRLPARPPVAVEETPPVMTAGDHVVVYTAQTSGREWRSVLYNTRTGAVITLPGQAYAAGGYVLWKQGTGYRLAQVN